jgi:hypothetical protein
MLFIASDFTEFKNSQQYCKEILYIEFSLIGQEPRKFG